MSGKARHSALFFWSRGLFPALMYSFEADCNSVDSIADDQTSREQQKLRQSVVFNDNHHATVRGTVECVSIQEE